MLTRTEVHFISFNTLKFYIFAYEKILLNINLVLRKVFHTFINF